MSPFIKEVRQWFVQSFLTELVQLSVGVPDALMALAVGLGGLTKTNTCPLIDVAPRKRKRANTQVIWGSATTRKIFLEFSLKNFKTTKIFVFPRRIYF